MGVEMRIVEDKHLGGYYDEGDPDTYAPEVWGYLMEKFGVGTVLDVGCGPGKAIDFFLAKGRIAFGVDGSETVKKHAANPSRIFIHDFTTGVYTSPANYDLIWSCEFVEHVEEKFADNFLTTFQCAKMVAMTHAIPGQHGWHHVNCKPREYWVEKMKEKGFRFVPEQVAVMKDLLDGKPYGKLVRATLLFFVKDTV
jgi:SAM-dependent methyltransferase